MNKVVVAGHICIDLIPHLAGAPSIAPGALVETGPIEIRPGGSVFNTGSALAELGVGIDAVTTIGDDILGEMLRESLSVRSIDQAGIVAIRGANTSYSIVIEAAGRSRTLWHHVGAAAAFTGAGLDASHADLVHLGYPPALPGLLGGHSARLLTLLAQIRQQGATASVDMSVVDPASDAASIDWSNLVDRMVRDVDVFSPSIDDLVSFGYLAAGSGRNEIALAADRLVSRGAAVVLLSDGARGSLLRTASSARLAAGGRVLRKLGAEWAEIECWIEPEVIGDVVTTNGAGDTSTAGLLYALMNRYSPEAAGRFAATLAATRIRGQELETALTMHAETQDRL